MWHSGLALHQSIRKHLIGIQVRKYLDGSNNALVVIGGGLDSLALERSASDNQGKIVELDHPWTQQTKKLVLKLHSSDAPALHLTEFDASEESLHEVLQSSDMSSIEAAVFVCEGVLMYLPEEKVRNLLKQVATIFPDTTLIFTFMDKGGMTALRILRKRRWRPEYGYSGLGSHSCGDAPKARFRLAPVFLRLTTSRDIGYSGLACRG